MALVVKDRVQETSTTTGTGTLTLSGATTGYQTFSSAIGNTNTTYYAIQNGAEWEVGIGTVSAGALSRDTVLESSNGGSLVNLSSGSKFVFCTYPAEKSVYSDASQNVGIGTSSPNVKLDVFGTIWSRNGGAAGAIAALSSDATSGANGITLDATFATGGFGPIKFNTSNTERMRIDSSGNVGIGTSSPTQKLEVNGGGLFKTGADDYIHLLSDSGAIEVVRSAGNAYIDLKSSTGEDYDARIQAVGTSGVMGFNTAGTERMRLDASGNLLFNSGYGSVATAYGCRAWVNFNGTGTIAIRASGNVTSITDNGAGLYTVNMTNAMPDINYTINVSTGGSTTTALSSINSSASAIIAPTTSAFRIYSYTRGAATAQDAEYINISVFR